MSQPDTENKIVIGWREWCAFPELNIPAIKVKIDTGAKTSAIHADFVEAYSIKGEPYVRFTVHPLQRNREITCVCEAKVKDYRLIISSNGGREKRYVIETNFKVGNIEFKSDLTLTTRYGMKFRMLLGRDSLKQGNFLIDSTKSYALGKQKNAIGLYK